MPLEPFDAVVVRHGPAVLRVCRAVAGPGAADDAWSETFLSALRAYPELPPDADVRAWLLTIARRRAVDQLRAAARRPVPVEDLPHPPSTHGLPGGAHGGGIGTGPGPGSGDGSGADLWDLLAALPPRQRGAVAYHHVAGLPYAEVAELLGGTSEAARRAASDGIAALRRALAGRPSAGGPGGPAPAGPAPGGPAPAGPAPGAGSAPLRSTPVRPTRPAPAGGPR